MRFGSQQIKKYILERREKWETKAKNLVPFMIKKGPAGCVTWEQGRKGVRSRNINQSQSGTTDILKHVNAQPRKIRAPYFHPQEHCLLLVNRYCTHVEKHRSNFIWENNALYPGFQYDRDQSDKTACWKDDGWSRGVLRMLFTQTCSKAKESVVFAR